MVQFFCVDTRVPVFPRSKSRAFIPELFKREKQRLNNIDYIFCSDEYLLKINQQFLNHDYYTDIITFDISESTRYIDAEIYISIDRVRDNAKQFAQPVQKELLRVIFHGALHLCGYKDKTKEEQEAMRLREDYYLRKFMASSAK